VPNNVFEYTYEDMVTSLLLSFFIKDNTDFADFYSRIQELVHEVSEDNMPFSFTLDDDLDKNNLVEF
jgi:hypothetical protein